MVVICDDVILLYRQKKLEKVMDEEGLPDEEVNNRSSIHSSTCPYSILTLSDVWCVCRG